MSLSTSASEYPQHQANSSSPREPEKSSSVIEALDRFRELIELPIEGVVVVGGLKLDWSALGGLAKGREEVSGV